ncbi:LysR family transcriptional regulator [uncultured Ruegeria sp.]|uniref:LysR family transcriptional regulator n=1 Tax=uncultured Ruegeria sp. TaxID=259304 RepID=UPI002626E3AD|nr:LysR family transcriptional regulator [uncultured Ruegeria sp.]
MIDVSSGLPPLTWLRAFEESARHLNFTRAANELGLTQSAVSQHVRNLEAFLGRDLFVRKTRVLELTEDGANYLPSIREAFALIASGTRAFIGSPSGEIVRLQCNMAFAVFWLTPRLHRLYAKHPWLVLDIVTPIWDPERHASQAAMEIRFGRPEEMPESAERLTSDSFFPVCTPGYQGGDVDLGDAVLFDCAGTTGTWDAWYQAQGEEFSRSGHVNLTSTYVISVNAALSDAGVAMAHDTLVSDLLAKGHLVRPFSAAAPLAEGYYLFPPSPHALTPAREAFLNWLREETDGVDIETGL